MATNTSAPPKSPPAIRACLFDMDGLLIDSEDIYTLCTNIVLEEYGRPKLPWNIKAQLQGRPGPESGRILAEWAQLPISHEAYLQKLHTLQKQHFPSCKPLPGVPELLQTLSKRTSMAMALATSSHAVNFRLKSAHLTDLFSVFPEENRVLGDDERVPKGRGKPAPDIYLLALKTINDRIGREGGEIRPEECLVFEDSVPGVEAGRRAGMQVVWCPHPELLKEFEGREERVLAGQTGEYKEVEGRDQEIGRVKGDGSERVKGKGDGQPGEVGDGFARLFHTLEGFPYGDYGIHVK